MLWYGPGKGLGIGVATGVTEQLTSSSSPLRWGCRTPSAPPDRSAHPDRPLRRLDLPDGRSSPSSCRHAPHRCSAPVALIETLGANGDTARANEHPLHVGAGRTTERTATSRHHCITPSSHRARWPLDCPRGRLPIAIMRPNQEVSVVLTNASRAD
jgi:hypothetical protein